MGALGTILVIAGAIAAIVGGVWIIVLAFKKSVLWGLGSIFVPFVALIFAIMNWAEAKKPFLIEVAGIVVLYIGIAVAATAN